MLMTNGVSGPHLSMTVLLIASALGFSFQPSVPADHPQTIGTWGPAFVRQQCTLSDGSTITLGPNASEAPQSSDIGWRAGEYVATPLRVTGHIILTGIDGRVDIPAGNYTLFVADSGNTATMIVSRKTGHWGMEYPGEQYDVGRRPSGFDIGPPIQGFVIGCMQTGNSPMFLWMQSGTHVTYAKIIVVIEKDGKTEYRAR